MKISTRTRLAMSTALIGLMTPALLESTSARHPDPAFQMTASGELIRPTDYRGWTFVGTPVTPNDMNGGSAAFPEFHNVYIDPASYEAYKRSGQWRDGTVMVKELVSVGTKAATSGKGYFQGDFIGLEVSVKSSAHSGDEPGNWAYFSFTDKKGGPLADRAKAFATASCNACHQGAAGQDFVFTQYYPVLRAARGAGRHPENAAARPATSGK